MKSDPRDQLVSEIGAIQEHLVEAVVQQRPTSLTIGLSVFQTVATAVFKRSSIIASLLSGEPVDPPFGIWKGSSEAIEVGEMASALWPVIEAAGRASDQRAMTAALNTVDHIATEAWDAKDLRSFEQFTSMYEKLAQLRLLGDPLPSFISLDFLVKRLAVLWGGMIGQQVPPRWREPTADELEAYAAGSTNRVAFTRSLVGSAVRIGREAIDYAVATQIDGWAQAYQELFALTWEGRDGGAEAEGFGALQQAGYLAVQTWLLLTVAERRGRIEAEEAPAVWQQLRNASHAKQTWGGAALLRDADLGRTMGWHWWELSSPRLRPEGRAISFEAHALDAVVLELSASPEARSAIPHRADALESASIPKMLLDAASSIQDRMHSLPDECLAGLPLTTDALSTLVRQEARLRSDTLTGAQMDAEKIGAFQNGVLESLGESWFLKALATCDNPPPRETFFGLSTLAPKYYFITTEVDANPRELGKRYGSDLVAGEEGLVWEEIVGQLEARTVPLAEVSSIVDGAIAQLSHDYVPIVIVASQYAAWYRLMDEMRLDDDKSLATPLDRYVSRSKIVYRLTHAEGFSGILVADLDELVAFCRTEILDGPDDLLAENRVVASIEAISEDRAAEIVAQRGGEPGPDEDEVRHLREDVHIRVFTKPVVQIRDRGAGRIIQISDADVYP